MLASSDYKLPNFLKIIYFLDLGIMPGGRRNVKSNTFKHHVHLGEDRYSCDVPAPQQAMPPKHVPLPDLPMSSELGFEFNIFLFCILAMSGQYLNLYRSVFWLPYSNTDYVLNFYLIDLFVLYFNLIIIGRKLPVTILKQLCALFLPSSCQPTCTVCIKLMVACIMSPYLMWCSYHIFSHHGILSIFYLGYPLVVCVILFGPTITQVTEHKENSSDQPSLHKLRAYYNKNSTVSVSHVCSMCPETVREEVEILKTDFNYRLKLVLFNSLLLAYYVSFVPCCFAQSGLFYETYWVGQYIVLTWISCLTMHMLYYFPSQYYDILHRAALHLGRWQKVEQKNLHAPYNMWVDTTMWNQGAHVKHNKEFFKAEGIANAAEPGNSMHSRFYTIFHNPSNPLGYLTTIQILLVLFQLYLMMTSYDWYQLFAMQFLMIMNCKTLYKVIRDVLVIKKVYKEEKALLIKCSS